MYKWIAARDWEPGLGFEKSGFWFCVANDFKGGHSLAAVRCPTGLVFDLDGQTYNWASQVSSSYIDCSIPKQTQESAFILGRILLYQIYQEWLIVLKSKIVPYYYFLGHSKLRTFIIYLATLQKSWCKCKTLWPHFCVTAWHCTTIIRAVYVWPHKG